MEEFGDMERPLLGAEAAGFCELLALRAAKKRFCWCGVRKKFGGKEPPPLPAVDMGGNCVLRRSDRLLQHSKRDPGDERDSFATTDDEAGTVAGLSHCRAVSWRADEVIQRKGPTMRSHALGPARAEALVREGGCEALV